MTERPWHERTPHVVGASIAALIAIGLLYFAGAWLTRHYNQPQPAPVPVIIDSSTTPGTAASTTTSSATTSSSTTPPSTTEIDLPPATDTTTTSTETSITQSRQSHTTTDPRWPYPFTSRPHTTVLPQPQH